MTGRLGKEGTSSQRSNNTKAGKLKTVEVLFVLQNTIDYCYH